ncbi:mRNA decay activator protein ZFP36 isoform X1 [Electrophorus electricus]|uniref:mRNA decay activator protein ZFP36 n=1 Tax=Electrophorus electricus TaxID=8005 RepID=A0A4W4HL76_ELEEL|nr:mRNA decay activator protein ZFP36 isoform X1 [Electrophorus electricus]
MSDTYDDILRNLINIDLNDHFPRQQEKPMLQRPSSLFSQKSISSERLTEETLGWPFDIWSETAPRSPYPFRSDRSMSLTDSCLPKMRTPELPPPPGFPPLAPQASNRYKTELCRSYQENGSCKYGSKCQFAHGERELRCLYRHPKYKTEACRTFYNFGYCPYGARCHFIHEEKLSVKALSPKTHLPDGNPRLLRQSVSFAGFLGSRSASPPMAYEPVGFSRAPSVSPPPTDVLSPVFSDPAREMFPFPQSRTGDADIPFKVEPKKSSRCVCGQGNGNNFPSSLNKCTGKENRSGAFFSQLVMQRFPSDESLSDRESYSSTGSSSGSESPTFDGSSAKRLTVFARMSVSE